MTEDEIRRIREQKIDFYPSFIQKIDREWQEIMKLFQGCRYDLSKIRIVKKKI